jgi:hypothetical protein
MTKYLSLIWHPPAAHLHLPHPQIL